ncbi:MAG: UvrD-helicase domain-containing protein, partial [Actinomycetota bacterium]
MSATDQPSLFDAPVDDAPVHGAPADQPARDAIENDLTSTLFVEAGAGAGKTTALVARVVNLVEHGADIRSIAPITFTEKAAAELRHRIREQLGVSASERAVAALAHLDHAPIGTLHAFARRILDDFALDAGLPPRFSVLDELESNLRFDEEWEEHLDELLRDPEPRGGVADGGADFAQMLDVAGFRLERDLRQVADDFRHDWDLVEAHVDRSDPDPMHLSLDDIAAEAAAIGATPTPPDDRQTDRVDDIRLLGLMIAGGPTLRMRIDALDQLREKCEKVGRVGAKKNWGDAYGGADALDELRSRQTALFAHADDVLTGFKAHRRRVVGTVCGRFVVDGAQRRVEAGTLEFHDLLVHTRRLLATRPDVRRRLHERYTHLLLDEFQDTDPIQLEIAVRLTADPDDPLQDADWRRLVPIPGRLFIVGDPKQSIYRFRRADIAQDLRAAEQIGASTSRLTANFRSSEPVIR